MYRELLGYRQPNFPRAAEIWHRLGAARTCRNSL